MDRVTSSASQSRHQLALPATAFPYRRELSLDSLIAAWEAAAAEPGVAGDVARAVCRGLEAAPELRGRIDDLSVIEKHHELVSVLMSRVFPAGSWDRDYMAATVPFQLRAVHATPSFRRLLLDADGTLQGWVNMSAEGAAHGRLLYAYDAILRAHYGMTLDVDYPLILAARDPESGLERYFRIQFDARFVEVRAAPPAAAARRDDAGGDPAAGGRPRAARGAAAGRRVRVLRVRRRAGDGRDGPGGALRDRAGPDRQGVDRLERPLPGARGQAADAPPAAGAAPRPGRVPGRARVRPELQLRDGARLHLRGHRAPPDERLRRVRPRARGHPGPAPRRWTI